MTNDESTARSSGVFVVATRREGLGGVVRLIEYENGDVRRHDRSAAHLTSSRASILWCARYAPGVLANGWEPYDQPNPSLYMPLRYSALERVEYQAGWTTWVQRRSSCGPLRAELVAREQSGLLVDVPAADEQATRRALARALSWIGFPSERVASYCDQIMARTSRAMTEAAA